MCLKTKRNCFNCELERACITCSDRISQKKSLSTNINIFKRRPANEYHQMLPYYMGDYEPKRNDIDFESAREIFIEQNVKKL